MRYVLCAVEVQESYCVVCDASAQGARALPGTRLGRLERGLLLRAPSPRSSRWEPLPAPPGSAGVAQRRAVAALVAKGLIVVQPIPGRDTRPEVLLAAGGRRKWLRMRLLARTYLGDAVVEEYGAELRGGARIRWDAERVERVLQYAIARCPHKHTRLR